MYIQNHLEKCENLIKAIKTEITLEYWLHTTTIKNYYFLYGSFEMFPYIHNSTSQI
jgi:hypothetical protein